MAENKQVVYTFHRVREQCEQGNPAAWRNFLAFYAPLCQHMLAMYAPDPAGAEPLWKKMLQTLAENNFERFRATARQSEREFLLDVRALLLDVIAQDDAQRYAGRTGSAAADGAASDPAVIDAERLAKLLEDMPLLHQEMVFFKLAGYGEGSIEKMLRVAPSVAAKSFERLQPDFAAAMNIQNDRCLWPTEWLATMQQARAAKKETCAVLHQILRIQDGQVSWYDKEPVEKHVAGCLYCLERWTALREVGYWRQKAAPVSAAQIDEWLRVLPLGTAEKATKKSFVRRMFG